MARATHEDGGELLLVGLSMANVNRLLQGQPIRICQEVHGEAVPEGWEIVILVGVSEQDLYRQFKEAGIVHAGTKVNLDPKLGISDDT